MSDCPDATWSGPVEKPLLIFDGKNWVLATPDAIKRISAEIREGSTGND